MQTEQERKQIQQLFNDVLRSNKRFQSLKNQKIITKAFILAQDAHKDVRRKTGELFITHPLEVAKIVAYEIGLDTISIVCALLHDVVEDSADYSISTIETLFGKKISSVIDGLTKITDVYDAEQNIQTETFKKMLLTIPQDVRVIYIKIADRLHNMRTLHGMPYNKQLIKAGETLYIYSPIAQRLGLYEIKKELEDLSFKYRHKEEYKKLKKLIKVSKTSNKKIFRKFTETISHLLNKKGFTFTIKPIKRSLYSIWTKMLNNGISFDEVQNYVIIRIIIQTPKDEEREACYSVFATITKAFPPKMNTLKDSIGNPNPDGYEELTIIVMGPFGQWLKIQILTKRMNKIAEKGEMFGNSDEEIGRNKWIKTISEHLKDPKASALDILDNVKLGLYTSVIYVFTPKGKIITLPKDSTVLDFAFYIHTNVGYRCIAAKINRKPSPKHRILKSTDQVEIITSHDQAPEPEWLEIVKTQRARNGIKTIFRKDRLENIAIGEDMLNELLLKLKTEKSDDLLNKLTIVFQCKNTDDLFLKIAKKIITPTQLIKKIKPRIIGFRIFDKLKTKSLEVKKQTIEKIDSKKNFIIDEDDADNKYQRAICCNPIPEDTTIAYQNKEGIVILHQTNCDEAVKLAAQQGKNVVNVEWGYHTVKLFLTRLKINGIDRKEMLIDIAKIVTYDSSLSIRAINLSTDDKTFEGTIDSVVHNNSNLKKIISKLKSVKGILHVARVNNFEGAVYIQ
jgi:GTP pyrophosphokinase